MNGLSVMKRTASTSSSIFAVSSAITALSRKPVIVRLLSPPLVGRGRGAGREVMRKHRRCHETSRPPPRPPHKGEGELTHHLPLDRLAAAIDQGALVGTGDLDFLRRGPRRLL